MSNASEAVEIAGEARREAEAALRQLADAAVAELGLAVNQALDDLAATVDDCAADPRLLAALAVVVRAGSRRWAGIERRLMRIAAAPEGRQ